MPAIRILPYKNGSRSVRALKQSLDAVEIRLSGSSVHLRNHNIINWGNSGRNLPPRGLGLGGNTIINSLSAVANAGNKLSAFRIMHEAGVRVPDFTEEQEVAQEWLRAGRVVVERHTLTGNSGQGIRLVGLTEPELTPAPLYVKYVPKQDEYRIHVAGGEVIDVQRKARNRDVPDEEVNWQIRNHSNGFIFARQDVEPPRDVIDQSLSAVRALGLDFGAVDVVWNNRNEQATVLEVNTAPGLEGTTLERYTEALTALVRGDRTQPAPTPTPEPEVVSESRTEPPEETFTPRKIYWTGNGPQWSINETAGTIMTIENEQINTFSARSSTGVLWMFNKAGEGLQFHYIERDVEPQDDDQVVKVVSGRDSNISEGEVLTVQRDGNFYKFVDRPGYGCRGFMFTDETSANQYAVIRRSPAYRERNNEPSQQPVVQSNTGDNAEVTYSSYQIVVNGNIDPDQGTFDNRDAAVEALAGDFYYNLRQMNPDLNIEVRGVA